MHVCNGFRLNPLAVKRWHTKESLYSTWTGFVDIVSPSILHKSLTTTSNKLLSGIGSAKNGL